MTKIISPDGTRWVVVVGIKREERLVPTQIGRLDRRLGLKSPWFSIYDEDEAGQ